jgi:hypothetical protein
MVLQLVLRSAAPRDQLRAQYNSLAIELRPLRQ